MLAQLRRYVDGEISTQEIKRYIDSVDKRESGVKQIKLRTYAEEQAQKIVDRAHRRHKKSL